jgi:hypothetical protein
MPELVKINQNLDAPLEREVLGYALCALPSPIRVMEISLLESPQCETIRDEALHAAHPSYFAVAMNEGQLPHLERLDMVMEWEFLAEEPNLSLVMAAILLGRLREVTQLHFEHGPCLAHLAKAFKHRLFLEQCPSPLSDNQVMIENLYMYHPGPEQGKSGPLSDLLSLPIFGSLVDLNVGEDMNYWVEHITGQGRALAAYFRQPGPGGRPSLTGLMFDGRHMPPLAEALAENCAPNLRSLHVLGGDASVFSHLRTVYQGGALAYLHELIFEDFMLAEDLIRAWMDAVLTSTHKGAALKILRFDGGKGEDIQDGLNCTLALLDGVRRGAYPNVERFDTRKVQGKIQGSFFHLTDETIGEYIDALGEDFPWSGTLESLSVRRTGSGAAVTRLPELRALLGGAQIYCTDA